MKKNIQYIILLVFPFFALVSCEKDDPKPDMPNSNDNAIVQYIKSTNEATDYTNYSYDSINRLVKMENGPTDVMKMEYSYNSSGKISTMKVTDSEGINLTTFEYNTEGLLTNAYTDNGLSDFNFEFDNKKLVKVFSYGNIPIVGRTLMVRTEFDYDGENVCELREYSLNIMTNSLSLTENITYEHDNRKNPFYELDIENCILNVGHEQYASKNNCTKRTVVKSTYGDPIGSYSMIYEYNANGYPTLCNDGTQFTY